VNDGPAIQLAHDDIVRRGRRGVLYLPSGAYRIEAGLRLDASFVSLVSDGAVINAAGLSSGSALTVSGTATPPYDQSLTSISGLKIVGPGRELDVAGFCFNRTAVDPNSSAGPSHLTVRNCNLNGFRVGFSFENHCYNLDLYSCDAYDCGTCISIPGGTIDAGERIIFYGGTFFNSGLAVDSRNPNSMLYLIGSSLDYNERQLVIDNAHVTLTDCHVEARDHVDAPIEVNGSGGSLHVAGGWFVLTGKPPRQVPAIVRCGVQSEGPGGVMFCGTFLNNLMTRASSSAGPRFSIGSGPVRLLGIQSYEISQNPRIIGQAQNRLRDGSFRREIPPDPVIIADTGPITDTLSGSNLELSSADHGGPGGRRALRCHKRGPTGTPAAFALIIPVAPGQIADFELSYRRPGIQPGVVYIAHGYARATLGAGGVPAFADGTTRGATTAKLPQVDSGWVRVGSGEPSRRAPGWATCFFVEVNLADFSGGDIYFDSAVITVIE
jgi:hypothetical protein